MRHSLFHFILDLKNMQSFNTTENPRLLQNNTKIFEFRIILHECSSVWMQGEYINSTETITCSSSLFTAKK